MSVASQLFVLLENIANLLSGNSNMTKAEINLYEEVMEILLDRYSLAVIAS